MEKRVELSKEEAEAHAASLARRKEESKDAEQVAKEKAHAAADVARAEADVAAQRAKEAEIAAGTKPAAKAKKAKAHKAKK